MAPHSNILKFVTFSKIYSELSWIEVKFEEKWEIAGEIVLKEPVWEPVIFSEIQKPELRKLIKTALGKAFYSPKENLYRV